MVALGAKNTVRRPSSLGEMTIVSYSHGTLLLALPTIVTTCVVSPNKQQGKFVENSHEGAKGAQHFTERSQVDGCQDHDRQQNGRS